MIQETYQLYFEIQQQNQIFDLSTTLQLEKLNSVSLSYFAIPNILNQIKQDFYITINSTQINFYKGLLSFQQIIDKIKKAFQTFTVKEYLKNDQSSNKLFIKDGDNNITFSISDQNYVQFFGNIAYDNTEKALISQYQCVLQQPNVILIHSNLVLNNYQVFGSNDVLYCTTLNQVPPGNYFAQKNIDIVQNRRSLSRVRQVSFKITDENNNEIEFPGSQIQLGITMFDYRTQFLDVILSDLRTMLKLYGIKNFNQEIQILDDEEQERQAENNQIQPKGQSSNIK